MTGQTEQMLRLVRIFAEDKRQFVGFVVWQLICLTLFVTLLHSERPKLHTILAFLNAIGLKKSLSIFQKNLQVDHLFIQVDTIYRSCKLLCISYYKFYCICDNIGHDNNI